MDWLQRNKCVMNEDVCSDVVMRSNEIVSRFKRLSSVVFFFDLKSRSLDEITIPPPDIYIYIYGWEAAPSSSTVEPSEVGASASLYSVFSDLLNPDVVFKRTARLITLRDIISAIHDDVSESVFHTLTHISIYWSRMKVVITAATLRQCLRHDVNVAASRSVSLPICIDIPCDLALAKALAAWRRRRLSFMSCASLDPFISVHFNARECACLLVDWFAKQVVTTRSPSIVTFNC